MEAQTQNHCKQQEWCGVEGSWECLQVSSLWYFTCCTDSLRRAPGQMTPRVPGQITSHHASLPGERKDDILGM